MKKVVTVLVLLVVFLTACSTTDYEEFLVDYTYVEERLENLTEYDLKITSSTSEEEYSESADINSNIEIVDGDRTVSITEDSGKICKKDECEEYDNLDSYQQVEIVSVINEINDIVLREANMVEYTDSGNLVNFYTGNETITSTVSFDFKNKVITYVTESASGEVITYEIKYYIEGE